MQIIHFDQKFSQSLTFLKNKLYTCWINNKGILFNLQEGIGM